MPDRVEWERLPGEPIKAYAAFCIYRDMGMDRTLLKVWQQLSGKKDALQTPGGITAWSATYNWVERTRSYEAWLLDRQRRNMERRHLQELRAYRRRSLAVSRESAETGMMALRKAAEALEATVATSIKPGELAGLLRAAAQILDSSLNAEAESVGVRRLETLLADLENNPVDEDEELEEGTLADGDDTP